MYLSSGSGWCNYYLQNGLIDLSKLAVSQRAKSKVIDREVRLFKKLRSAIDENGENFDGFTVFLLLEVAMTVVANAEEMKACQRINRKL